MKTTFSMIPASSGSMWFLAVLGALFFAILLLFVALAWGARHTRYEVSPQGLAVQAPLWGRELTFSQLDLERARPVNLRQDPELRIKWRTWGAGLPGYGAGWFRLRNGEKALAHVTDSRRVLYLPTREGYALMLSVEDPESMLTVLRRTGGAESG